MSIPCDTYLQIVQSEDPCNGKRVEAGCVFDSVIYSELSLSANATQKEINQAIYLAYLNLKNTTEELEDRVLNNVATNTTTLALTLANLTSLYSTAAKGFKVQALSIVSGGRIYEKTETGWCEYLTTIIV